MPQFTNPPDEQFCVVNGKDEIAFVVGGDPVPKKRVGRTALGRAYNPNERAQKEFAAVAAYQFTSCGVAVPFFARGICLCMELEFYFPVHGKQLEDQEKSLCAKGDVDNFAKFVQDALQGTIYEDDNQITALWVKKFGTVGTGKGYTLVKISRPTYRLIQEPVCPNA